MLRYLSILVVLTSAALGQVDDNGVPINYTYFITLASAEYTAVAPGDPYPAITNPLGSFSGMPILFVENSIAAYDGFLMAVKFEYDPPILHINSKYMSLIHEEIPGHIEAVLALLIHEAMHKNHNEQWSLYCQNLPSSQEQDCEDTKDCHEKVIAKNIITGYSEEGGL